MSEKFIRLRLREISEIYVGMEGGIPKTAYEGYLLQEMKRMYDGIIELLTDLKTNGAGE